MHLNSIVTGFSPVRLLPQPQAHFCFLIIGEFLTSSSGNIQCGSKGIQAAVRLDRRMELRQSTGIQLFSVLGNPELAAPPLLASGWFSCPRGQWHPSPSIVLTSPRQPSPGAQEALHTVWSGPGWPHRQGTCQILRYPCLP